MHAVYHWSPTLLLRYVDQLRFQSIAAAIFIAVAVAAAAAGAGLGRVIGDTKCLTYPSLG